MRIIQITDSHIGLDGECSLGVDVRANFQQLVQHIESIECDLIVHTGDFCLKEPTHEAYHWTKKILLSSSITAPIRYISGNHDNNKWLIDCMSLNTMEKPNDELYYHETIGGASLYFLDSSSKRVSKEQLDWLKSQLSNDHEESIFIFIHHPPVLADVPFMEPTHALENMNTLRDVFNAYAKKFFVFTGHYHIDKSIYDRNVQVYITPSSYLQIDQVSSDFQIDHCTPGYRIIDLDRMDDELIVRTSVHYLF